MPTFKELSAHPTLPVIYSRSGSGTILTAVKVPRDDVRLEKWGWILSKSNKDGSSSQDETAFTLQGDNGQQYSKIFTSDEVGNYSEKNGYEIWEIGYYDKVNKIQSRRDTIPLDTSLLQKEMLQATLENLADTQRELNQRLKEEFAVQNRVLYESGYAQFAPRFDKVAEIQNEFSQLRQETQKQLEALSENLTAFINKSSEIYDNIHTSNDEKTQMLISGVEQMEEQLPKNIYNRMKADFDLSLNKIDQQLDTMDNELKLQLAQVQNTTSKTIEQHFTPLVDKAQEQLIELDKTLKTQAIQSHNDLIEDFKNYVDNSQKLQEELNKETKEQIAHIHEDLSKEIYAVIKDNTDKQEKQLKDIQEQVKQVLQLSDFGIGDLEIPDDDDLVTVATSIAKKPSTRISRIANEQLRLSKKYYDNANEQSKRSFHIALILSIVGGIIFILTIAVVLLAEVFHFQNNPSILPGGTILSIISEVLAGLNFLYDRATKQFILFQEFLDRILRASIAQAITEEIKDDEQRQKVVEKIVDNLLKYDNNSSDQSKDTTSTRK